MAVQEITEYIITPKRREKKTNATEKKGIQTQTGHLRRMGGRKSAVRHRRF